MKDLWNQLTDALNNIMENESLMQKDMFEKEKQNILNLIS